MCVVSWCSRRSAVPPPSHKSRINISRIRRAFPQQIQVKIIWQHQRKHLISTRYDCHWPEQHYFEQVGRYHHQVQADCRWIVRRIIPFEMVVSLQRTRAHSAEQDDNLRAIRFRVRFNCEHIQLVGLPLIPSPPVFGYITLKAQLFRGL